MLAAVQEQPAGAFIAKLDAPPAEAGDADPGVSAKEHETPAWVAVNVCPPAVIVALRLVPAVLAATL